MLWDGEPRGKRRTARGFRMTTQRNIYLIGFMGTGKTTTGRILASRLGMRFVDMDDLIVERAGKPVPRIFAEDGEPHFRALERAVAHELSQQAGWVVATGGGVVTNPGNLSDFAASGLTVCLTADPETILRRVAGDTNRPLLSGSRDEKMQKMQALLEKRRALYAAVPHQVDTSRLTPEAVASLVEALLR
jgi:shikimate kinase